MYRLLIAILIIAIPAISDAQNRARTWEWSVAGLYQDSKNMGGENGSSLRIDGAAGLGFNLSYNLTDKFAVGVDLDWLRPDYRAELVNDEAFPIETTVIDHEFSQFNGRIKGTFNFTEGPLTPYVEGGFGWSYFDSNVADGPPLTGCYWHPYWGYICNNYYSTFTETSFSYGAGLGLRYQMPGGTFVKGSYNVWDLDSLGSAEDSTITGFKVEFGWSF
jgi:opacity protein-like surface antigen